MGTVAAITSTVVAVAVVAAATILAVHGTINGEAATGIFGTLIGGGLSGGTAVVAHRAGAKAATESTRK